MPKQPLFFLTSVIIWVCWLSLSVSHADVCGRLKRGIYVFSKPIFKIPVLRVKRELSSVNFPLKTYHLGNISEKSSALFGNYTHKNWE